MAKIILFHIFKHFVAKNNFESLSSLFSMIIYIVNVWKSVIYTLHILSDTIRKIKL